ncbi:MAG: hypothetical protein V1772_10810, partial [Chloroflexota bacterium]
MRRPKSPPPQVGATHASPLPEGALSEGGTRWLAPLLVGLALALALAWALWCNPAHEEPDAMQERLDVATAA